MIGSPMAVPMEYHGVYGIDTLPHKLTWTLTIHLWKTIFLYNVEVLGVHVVLSRRVVDLIDESSTRHQS